MITQFNWAICAIVPADQAEKAGAAVAAATGKPEDINTFLIPLSEKGDFPATYYACNTVVEAKFYWEKIPMLLSDVPEVKAFDLPYEYNFEGQEFALIKVASFEDAIKSLNLKPARPQVEQP